MKQNTIYTLAKPLLALALLVPFSISGVRAEEKKARFDAGRIREQVSYLASDELRGRGSGEKGNELAAQYIAKNFASSGLKPLGTTRQGDTKARLDGKGYFQPFTFTAGRVAGRNSRLEASYSDKRIVYRPTLEFEPSLISGSGKADGDLVFVGYGIQDKSQNYDSYAGLDMKGKVALFLSGTLKNDPNSPLFGASDVYRKALAAREAGAVAAIVIMPESGTVPASRVDNKANVGIPVLQVRATAANLWLKSGGKELSAVQSELDAGKMAGMPLSAKVKLVADVQKFERVSANVIGLLEGSDPILKNQYVVVGAHMDHLGNGGSHSLDNSGKPAIHYGADDNASGTSGVLQLAAQFANATTRPKRSILFMCYSGEELGLLGSAYYVANPLVPIDKTVAMINMDMIGRLKDNKLTVIGSGTATEWDMLLNEANRTANFSLSRNEGGFGGSDHQSFYVANVPVLFFFTGIHADYHRPSDTADKINYEGQAKILGMVADCLDWTANTPKPPTYQKVATTQGNAPVRSSGAYFGSIPNYTSEVEGVLLDGVREGSPAEKAGLKGGDIITKFGETRITNIQDYAATLGKYKPGDTLDVTVKRGTETLVLKVTLTARTP